MTATPHNPSVIEKVVRARLEEQGFKVARCEAAFARGKPLSVILLLEVADGSGNGVFCSVVIDGGVVARSLSFTWQPRGEFGFKLFSTVQSIIEKELL